MKILQTIPYFNKASGGPTSCTYQLVKGLVDQGVNCDILTFRPVERDIIATDYFIHYLPDDRKTPLWLSRNFTDEFKRTAKNYDIIHVNTIWTWPPHVSVRLAKQARLPIVISPHGMLYPQALSVSAWKKKLIGGWYVNADLKAADCLHATSEEEARHIRNYGLTNPIAIIPNGLDVSVYPQQRTTRNLKIKFGFTGRLNPIKQVGLLLTAWHRLGTKTENAELVIIGDGDPEYVASLRAYVTQNGMSNVSFTGFLSGSNLREMIRSLDYQILPSKSENFGMVVPEALICGVPVIASQGTPWSALEEFGCGWWIDVSENSLADTITAAMAVNESERSAMGQRGRNLVLERFSSYAIAGQMKELYEWLLNKGEKPSFVI